MARSNRGKSVNPSRVQVLHVYNRCTRQQHLMGRDPVTGKDRSHRRDWVRERLQHLAGIFAVEILTYAVLSTHVHQVLRSRPDLARDWDPETIARRWLSITPKYDRKTGEALEPTAIEIKRIANDAKRVEKLRLRLSDISWWMRYFSQYIAVRGNREDGCGGHFWDGRFKDKLLLDVASILRCMLYVDLNLVRAAMADSIQESDFTGAKDRLDDLRVAVATQVDGQFRLSLEPCGDAFHWERLDHPCSGWLSPIELDGRPLGILHAEAAPDAVPSMVSPDAVKPTAVGVSLASENPVSDGVVPAHFAAVGDMPNPTGEGWVIGANAQHSTGQAWPSPELAARDLKWREAEASEVAEGDGSEAKEQAVVKTFARRASDKGALPLSVAKYLMVLDLVGRRARAGGSAVINGQVESMTEVLGIEVSTLMESVMVFDKRYDIRERDSASGTTNAATPSHCLVRQVAH